MSMPGMTTEQRDHFLDEPGHLMRLGTTDNDGMPLVVPIWFIRDGNKLLFTPRAKSAWFGYLQRDARTGATIDEAGGTLRKVVVRGSVAVEHDVGTDDEWRDVYRDITMRYTPEHWGDAYLKDTAGEPRALLSLDMDAAEVTTWRMPSEKHEDRLAVWAKKYYHDGR